MSADDKTTWGRFWKYLVLIISLMLMTKIVFDGYSYYVMRRSIDSELEAKKISSLEYLSVLQDRERALILRLIKEGKSKDDIKRELVHEYGTRVLSTPQKSGFSLIAYVVPVAFGTLALGGIGIALYRWRRNPDTEQIQLDTVEP